MIKLMDVVGKKNVLIAISYILPRGGGQGEGGGDGNPDSAGVAM